jgi:DNA-binding LacI/PurR family transcriptional regulator
MNSLEYFVGGKDYEVCPECRSGLTLIVSGCEKPFDVYWECQNEHCDLCGLDYEFKAVQNDNYHIANKAREYLLNKAKSELAFWQARVDRLSKINLDKNQDAAELAKNKGGSDEQEITFNSL